eukprot:82188_1
MLLSFILMFISRMITFQNWLTIKFKYNWCIIRFLLDKFLNYKYIHLILGWFGLIISSLIHIIFIFLSGITNIEFEMNINNFKTMRKNNSIYHKYNYMNKIYLYDLIRIFLLLFSILLLIISNLGGTYYSHYAINSENINNKYLNKFKSIICNLSYDYGLNKKRYKL